MNESLKSINLKEFLKEENKKYNKKISIFLIIDILLYIIKILDFSDKYSQVVDYIFYSFSIILCGYMIWYIYIMLHNNLLVYRLDKNKLLEQINEELLNGKFNSKLGCTITDNYLIIFQHLKVIRLEDITRMYVVPKTKYWRLRLLSQNTLVIMKKNKEYNIYNSNIHELNNILNIFKDISKTKDLNIVFEKARLYEIEYFIRAVFISLITIPILSALIIIIEEYIL